MVGLIDANMFKGMGGNIATYFLIGVLLVLVGIIIFIVYTIKKFNIRFRVRMLAGDRKIIKDTRAREVYSKRGGHFLRVRGFRKNPAPLPPPEAIEIDKKGRRCIEAFLVPTGEFIYIDGTQKEDILKQLGVDPKTWVYMKDEHKSINAFEPLSTNSRALLIDQIVQSEEEKGLAWSQHIPTIVGGIVVVVVLLLVFMFWNKLTAPMEKVSVNLQATSENLVEATNRLDQIINDKQVLGSTTNRTPMVIR